MGRDKIKRIKTSNGTRYNCKFNFSNTSIMCYSNFNNNIYFVKKIATIDVIKDTTIDTSIGKMTPLRIAVSFNFFLFVK